MKKFILVGILVVIEIISFRAKSVTQTKSGVELKSNVLGELKQGDQLPNLTFEDEDNKDRQIKISDFKDKIVILDFWATWCGPCLNDIPKMEKLQKKFMGEIQVLLVNTESKKIASSFFKRRREVEGTDVTLPKVQMTPMLDTFFKFDSLPHYVWLDKNGIIIAITGRDEVIEPNIQAILDKSPIVMKQKKSVTRLDFDLRKPLFDSGNGGHGEGIIWHSVLSKYVEGLPTLGDVSCDSVNGYNGINAYNSSIMQLYQLAYNDRYYSRSYGLPDSRTILTSSNPEIYNPWMTGKILTDRLFIYQLIAPEGTFESLTKRMQDDLKVYFGLNASLKKVWKKCLVLTSEDTTLLKTKGGEIVPGFRQYEGVIMRNLPISYFILNLQYRYLTSHIIVDETNYDKNVDLEFIANLSDPISIDEGLSKYKLHLKEELREVNVLVLSDKE